MCGLVGVVNCIKAPLSSTVIDVFHDLLYLDVARGWHSTGVAAVCEDGAVRTVKEVVLPWNLINCSKYINKIVNKKPLILIGHNRSATQGNVIKKNAHPFTHGNITLAHNGTLIAKITGREQYETDSEGICSEINAYGIDNMYKNTHGALALSIWDDRKKILSLLTNGERPLSFVYLFNAIIWSSDKKYLEITLEHHNQNTDKIVTIIPHNMLSLYYGASKFNDDDVLYKEISTLVPPTIFNNVFKFSQNNGKKCATCNNIVYNVKLSLCSSCIKWQKQLNIECEKCAQCEKFIPEEQLKYQVSYGLYVCNECHNIY